MELEKHMEFFNRVFDLLVSIGGASEHNRQDFIYLHVRSKQPCDEYRFQGSLGHGGKYRRMTNKVDCYSEDETPARKVTVERLNAELKKLHELFPA